MPKYTDEDIRNMSNRRIGRSSRGRFITEKNGEYT